MRIQSFCFLVLFLSSLALSRAQESGFPVIRNYTPKEYNNAPQVWSAVQDKRGVMYFGTNSGAVLEYDGVSWNSVTIDKKAVPYDLSIDESGRIYVGASNEFGYLSPGNKGKITYQSLTHLFKDSIYKIGNVRFVKSTPEFVYFLTNDAILQYAPGTESLRLFKADTNGRFSGGFVFKDTYYLRLSKKGLMKIERNEMNNALQSEFFQDKMNFRAALPLSTSMVLVPTRTEGIFLYQPEKDLLPKPFPISNDEFLTDNDIYSASLFQNKYVIMGSLNKGALLTDKQGFVLQQYSESNLLQSNSVYDVATDSYQNIWMGLSNGISKAESGSDLTYRDKRAGLNGTVLSVIRFKGTIYIATDTKLYFIDARNQLCIVKNSPAGQNWHFLNFRISPDSRSGIENILLLGTSSGIFEIRKDEAFQLTRGDHAFKLLQSAKNPLRVFCSDYPDFFSMRYDRGKWINEGKWSGVNGSIRGITEDEAGNIWLGTLNNGIICVVPDSLDITKPREVRLYNVQNGLPSLKDPLPFRYKNRIVWGMEKGLYVYDSRSDKFEPFCELGEQFCNGSRDVSSLTEMPDGKIWIHSEESKNADIGYLQPDSSGEYKWVYAPFRRIPEMYLEAFYAEPSGIVWFGGSEGLYRYDISKDSKNYAQAFNCLVRKVTVGLDSILYGGSGGIHSEAGSPDAVLNFSLNTLKFEYAAPFFDQEERTVYSCQLVGFDKEWSKWSRDVKKEYSFLQEGSYTFQVKARNVYDVESPIATYQLTILPPFYRTWWAYSLYVVLSVLFILSVLRMYTKRLVSQKRELEKTIEEKTAEVVIQKNELQASNEELTASNEVLHNQREELETTLSALKRTQQQLIQAEKMASLGVLSAGIAHEINNPLNFIMGGYNGLDDFFTETGLSDERIPIYLSSIKIGVERAADIVKGLNQFSRNNDASTEDCDIHSILNNCLVMLNNQMRERIELTKNFCKDELKIVGNVGKLHQVFINILYNSLQAIESTGTIAIKTYKLEGRDIIEIVDSGCGISLDDLPKITDPFFTTKDPGQGTGLGLSIAYSIIQEHNGTIEFHSELNAGTTVKISFPNSQ